MESKDIRNAGLKVTLPRIKILEILEQREAADRHLSAEEISKCLAAEGEEIGLATVY
ncbi:MAG: transcriptional repressor, partial [Methylococcaceae bacterium]|nr:transcriptional repressor [Methylococcaceae bacterium]